MGRGWVKRLMRKWTRRWWRWLHHPLKCWYGGVPISGKAYHTTHTARLDSIDTYLFVHLCLYLCICLYSSLVYFNGRHPDHPPNISFHPLRLSNVLRGEFVGFSSRATPALKCPLLSAVVVIKTYFKIWSNASLLRLGDNGFTVCFICHFALWCPPALARREWCKMV